MQPIGYHTSPDLKITFTQDSPNLVGAKIGNSVNSIPVSLPEISYPPQISSLIDRVQFLLSNFHFRPLHLPPQQGKPEEVSFTQLPPENKTWEKYNEIPLPDGDTPWIVRSDSSLTYAFVNTVTTWNWKNNTLHVTSFNLGSITALSEMKGGVLIAGDNKGLLCIEANEPIDCGFQSPISEIIPIDESRCLIKTEKEACILAIRNKTIIVERMGSYEKTIVLKNGDIVALQQNQVDRWKFQSGKYEKIPSSFNEISRIEPAGDTTVMLFPTITQGKKKRIIVWDVDIEASRSYVSDDLWARATQNSLLFLGKDRFAASLNCSIYYYNKTEKISVAQAGKWSITAKTYLSDGSVMFATDTTPSGIHIAIKEGEVPFSSNHITSNRAVQSLLELPDGSVVVKFPRSFMIICPKINEIKSEKAAIERCKLEIRLNPTKLDLYHTLAKMYGTDDESKYLSYLAGLEAAMKSTNLYQARRFYEKARKIKPENPEPCQIFLSFLQQSSYSKECARISYQLERLQKQHPQPKPQARLKERLFLGEADFRYTAALLQKHEAKYPQLAKAITATEFLAPIDNETVLQRINQLKAKGVTVLFGIDGQTIHQTFQRRHFPRIHWNCPFPKARQREGFEKVIPNFFVSANQLQLVGDRIHVTLVQGSNYWKIRQNENPILEGAIKAGYRLIRKRLFGEERYPGYVHVKTNTTEKYTAGGEEREFVFEKTERAPSTQESFKNRAEMLRDPKIKNYQVGTDAKEPKPEDYYIECSSDEDSSDYESE